MTAWPSVPTTNAQKAYSDYNSMSKQTVQRHQRSVATQHGRGEEVISTLTVNDNPLPTPEELEAYHAIDPSIIGRIFDTLETEQKHRHAIDFKKMDELRSEDLRRYRTNILGLIFAFLSVIILTGAVVFAVLYDRPWIAGITGAATMIGVAKIFMIADQRK